MQRAVRLPSLLRPATTSQTARSLRSARLYSTNGSNDSDAAAASAAKASVSAAKWPLGITSEMLEQAGRSVDMNEVLMEADETMEEDVAASAGDLEDMYDLDSTLEEFKGDDSTSLGHHMLRNRREILQYFRLIELELPTLHGESRYCSCGVVKPDHGVLGL